MSISRHLFALSLLALVSTPAFADALCVHVAEANLRQGPGTQHGKSWEVFRYMPFKRLAQRGNWYQVEDVDGDRHWIHRPLVSDNLRCAVVRSNQANVRTGPGTSHPAAPFSPVPRYYAFKVLEVRGDWVRVEDEVANTGWVHRPLLWMP